MTLSPIADSDATFSGWGGACSGTSTCTVTMDSGQAVTALFVASGCSAEPVFIAASAHAAGVSDSQWRTDVSVFNPTEATAEISLSFLPSDQDGRDAACVSVGTAGGMSQFFFEDVIASALDSSGTGGLVLYSNASDLQVTSRTYAQTANGTFGQTIPGRRVGEAVADGETGVLLQLHQNDNYRTNIGFLNTAKTASAVEVVLYDGNGASVGSRSFGLKPYGHLQKGQIYRLVSESNITNGRAEVTVSGGPVLVYGSVVDAATSDPSYVEPQ